jgi:hypothetical protein
MHLRAMPELQGTHIIRLGSSKTSETNGPEIRQKQKCLAKMARWKLKRNGGNE